MVVQIARRSKMNQLFAAGATARRRMPTGHIVGGADATRQTALPGHHIDGTRRSLPSCTGWRMAGTLDSNIGVRGNLHQHRRLTRVVALPRSGRQRAGVTRARKIHALSPGSMAAE